MMPTVGVWCAIYIPWSGLPKPLSLFGSSASEKSELPKVRAGLLKTHGFRPHLNPLVPVPDWPRSNGYSWAGCASMGTCVRDGEHYLVTWGQKPALFSIFLQAVLRAVGPRAAWWAIMSIGAWQTLHVGMFSVQCAGHRENTSSLWKAAGAELHKISIGWRLIQQHGL